MKRTRTRIKTKRESKNPYLKEWVKLKRHWTKRTPSNDIPIGKILRVRKSPENEKKNFLYVWVKYKGKYIRLLLAEVAFIDPIAFLPKTPRRTKNISFKRTKSLTLKKQNDTSYN